MELDENLVAVHAYLCADGYVIKNPETQKQKYYKIGFRNTNLVLLKDFQEKFERVFGIKCSLYEGQRCQKGSREIYEKLTKKFGSFYSWEWKMPKISKELSKIWLRAYFDCEGWVFCKSHQNRHIGADCVNEKGLNQVIKALNNLNIKTIKKYNKKRNIYRIIIYGKENLERFSNLIGFLHPEKKNKLKEIIQDFVDYFWHFPKNEKKCREFVLSKLKEKSRLRKNRYITLFSREKKNLEKLCKFIKKFYNIKSQFYKRINGIGTIYYELNINRKEDIQKLIKLNMVPENIKLIINQNV